MEEEFRKKITKDLEKSGFGSQARAIQTCLANDWDCEGSVGYFDKDEEKTREIDLRASSFLSEPISGIPLIETWFWLAGEVKKSEKPWVVLKEKLRYPQESDAFNNLTHYEAPESWGENWTAHVADAMSRTSLLVRSKSRGSMIHECFKNPNAPSAWYRGFVSACKAAEGFLADEVEPLKILSRKQKNEILFYFVQPVLIFDGPLFGAELSSNGEISLAEIDMAPLSFAFRSRNYRRSEWFETYRVDLVCLSALAKYLKLCGERQRAIAAAMFDIALQQGA